MTDAFEEIQKKHAVVTPHEAVVDDLFAIGFGRAGGLELAETCPGFFTDLAHDGSVDGGGVDGAEWHDAV